MDIASHRDVLAFAAGGAILTAIFLAACWSIARRLPKRLIRQNFLGRSLPVIGGLAILPVGLFAGLWLASNSARALEIDSQRQAIAFTIAFVGLGCLGLLDDLVGDRSAGGFRGHIGKLVKEGRVTTGLIKLVGGGLLALCAAYELSSAELLHHVPAIGAATVALYGAFIALSANTFNLVDLRPGRCVSLAIVTICCILAACAVFGTGEIVYGLAAALFGGVLILLPFDRSGKIMLGDTGSNALGAGIAVCSCCIMAPWEAAIGVVALAVFQLWCEKHSLSRFIESKPLLRSIDRKIGVR